MPLILSFISLVLFIVLRVGDDTANTIGELCHLLPNTNGLVAIRKDMQAAKLLSNRIIYFYWGWIFANYWYSKNDSLGCCTVATRGDQKVLQLGYKKLTYYITHAVIFWHILLQHQWIYSTFVLSCLCPENTIFYFDSQTMPSQRSSVIKPGSTKTVGSLLQISY